jgi:uncharacterized metal-binding protein YceD (DUF177 family)
VLEEFKIWIDRLKEGDTQPLKATVSPAFLEIAESELQFPLPVEISGEAYLADIHLVIHLNASTKALMPCIVCNQMIETELKITDFYHTEPLSDIPGAIFDFGPILREALLIELPKYVECNQGHCPHRKGIDPFLKQTKTQGPDVHFPFADLES